jgi:hypothetical protein
VLNKTREWGWVKELQDLIRIGSDDANSSVEAIQFRVSNPLKKDWRARLKVGGFEHAQGDGVGNSRVWLLGDVVHAMQPSQYSFPDPLFFHVTCGFDFTPSLNYNRSTCSDSSP